MKQFNLHTQHAVTTKSTLIKIYSSTLSMLVIGLTTYTYYTLYMQQQYPLIQEMRQEHAPLKRSALYHCIKIIDKVPVNISLTTLTITQTHMSISGKQQSKGQFTTFLQELSKQYSIAHTKSMSDGTFTLELTPQT